MCLFVYLVVVLRFMSKERNWGETKSKPGERVETKSKKRSGTRQKGKRREHRELERSKK